MNTLIALYRCSNAFYRWHIPVLPGLISRMIRVLFSCDLPYSCTIGRGTLFKHNGLGTVVHHNAVIGKNCMIYQNVSIAGRNGRGVPIVGDNVYIGAGACVLGGIKIGNNAIIGANAVVLRDIPENETWGGIPAKNLHKSE